MDDQKNNPDAADGMSALSGDALSPEPKKGGIPGWVKGCGCGCLVVIILVVGVVGYGYYAISSKIKETEAQVAADGYKIIKQQEIREKAKITEKTFYMGSIVEIEDGADVDISIVGSTCKLSGNFAGKVDFNGIMLMVDKDSSIDHLDGNILMLINMGKITNKTAWIYEEQSDLPLESQKALEKQFKMRGDSPVNPADATPSTGGDVEEKSSEVKPAGK